MRAAAAILLISCAPLFGSELDREYYPMAIGTKWTYKVGGQEDKFVLAASKEEKVGDQECVKFEAKLKDQLVGTEHVAILKDGVYRFKFNDQAIEPPIRFFRANATKGETWSQEFKIGDSKASGKYEMDTEEVEVPAGKFPGALVVRAEATERAGDKEIVTKTSIWFAKKFGMVKQVITIGDTRIVLELEKMEEAKK